VARRGVVHALLWVCVSPKPALACSSLHSRGPQRRSMRWGASHLLGQREGAQLTVHCTHLQRCRGCIVVAPWLSYAPQEALHAPTRRTRARTVECETPQHSQLTASPHYRSKSAQHVQGQCSDGLCGLFAGGMGGMGGMRPASRGGMAPPGTGYGGPPPSTGMRGGVRTRHCMHACSHMQRPPSPTVAKAHLSESHGRAAFVLADGGAAGKPRRRWAAARQRDARRCGHARYAAGARALSSPASLSEEDVLSTADFGGCDESRAHACCRSNVVVHSAGGHAVRATRVLRAPCGLLPCTCG